MHKNSYTICSTKNVQAISMHEFIMVLLKMYAAATLTEAVFPFLLVTLSNEPS